MIPQLKKIKLRADFSRSIIVQELVNNFLNKFDYINN